MEQKPVEHFRWPRQCQYSVFIGSILTPESHQCSPLCQGGTGGIKHGFRTPATQELLPQTCAMSAIRYRKSWHRNIFHTSRLRSTEHVPPRMTPKWKGPRALPTPKHSLLTASVTCGLYRTARSSQAKQHLHTPHSEFCPVLVFPQLDV